MEFHRPTEEDWDFFARIALDEGWQVPRRELELLRDGAVVRSLTLKREGASPLGFVSLTRSGALGWIGNLIVPAAHRGRGCGGLLFDKALERLEADGATTVGLTASAMGRPLYEKKGFRAAGAVQRWEARAPGGGRELPAASLDELIELDAGSWGSRRDALLRTLMPSSCVLASGATRALLQRGEDMNILGPWLSPELCPRENRLLLVQALERCRSGSRLLCDLLESSPVSTLMQAAGFERRSRVDLMLRGTAPPAFHNRLVALASLGSLG